MNADYYFYKNLKHNLFLMLCANTGKGKELATESVLIKHKF
jgi:hypothetical protein